MAARGIKMPFETAMDTMISGHLDVNRKAYDGDQTKPEKILTKCSKCGATNRRIVTKDGRCARCRSPEFDPRYQQPMKTEHMTPDKSESQQERTAPKHLCVKGCGREVRRDGIMCGSCRGRVALEAKRAKRKETIMSGKPENLLKPMPVVEHPVATVTRDIIESSIVTKACSSDVPEPAPHPPDIGTVIGWWRDSQALASIRNRIADAKTAIMMLEKALDEARPIDTSLASLRNEIERSA